MTARARPPRRCAVLGRADARLVDGEATQRPRLPLETIREKRRVGVVSDAVATRSASPPPPSPGVIPLQICHDRIYEPYGVRSRRTIVVVCQAKPVQPA